MDHWEEYFEKKIIETSTGDDPAHDLLHFKRVVKIAKKLCTSENGNINVVLPAAWLHDLIIIPKNDVRRSLASRLSSEAALLFLSEINYPKVFFKDIAHAIESHSFSAKIKPQTLEAQIVQDADRLDALGAIGIARCFAVAGMLKRPFYNFSDPTCLNRVSDDGLYTLDHFFTKLFKLPDSLQTKAGRIEGERRVLVMKQFIEDFKSEI